MTQLKTTDILGFKQDLEGKLYEKDKRIEALQFAYDDLKSQYDYIKKDENVMK